MKIVEKRMEEISSEKHEKRKIEVEPNRGFHFYEGYGKPTDLIAISLEDFIQKIQKASIASIEFHSKRGDFIQWISQVLKEPELAQSIGELKSEGEELRIEIAETLKRALHMFN